MQRIYYMENETPNCDLSNKDSRPYIEGKLVNIKYA